MMCSINLCSKSQLVKGFCFYGGSRQINGFYYTPDKDRGVECAQGGNTSTGSTSWGICGAWQFTAVLQGNVNSVEGMLVPEHSLSLLVKQYETWGWVRIQAAIIHLCPTAAHTL